MPKQLQPAPVANLDFAEVVARVAADVLATMFFEEALPSACRHDWYSTAVSVRVTFDGSHRGEFRLRISPETSRSAASGFLGLDPEEMTGTQPAEVTLELANILCGALMSTLWPESNLSLEVPTLLDASSVDAPASLPATMHCCFTLPDGMVSVSIALAAGVEPA